MFNLVFHAEVIDCTSKVHNTPAPDEYETLLLYNLEIWVKGQKCCAGLVGLKVFCKGCQHVCSLG